MRFKNEKWKMIALDARRYEMTMRQIFVEKAPRGKTVWRDEANT